MNERIRELAARAIQEVAPGVEYKIMLSPAVEKFAELIVRECAEVGAQAFLKDNRIVPVFPANQIKQHFGVE